jgi:hypothetical protein
MYISLSCSDQDLHLGLLESPLLASSLESSEPSHFSIVFVHVLEKLCDLYANVLNPTVLCYLQRAVSFRLRLPVPLS